MHGGMVELAKYAHWTETEIHLGLHQQPKTMTMRHARAMESTDGAHSKGLGFTCLSQERVIHQAKALWCLGGAVTDPIRLIGPLWEARPPDYTDISGRLAPLRPDLNWTDPKQ